MFDRVGQIIYPAASVDADTMFEAVLEAGADNLGQMIARWSVRQTISTLFVKR